MSTPTIIYLALWWYGIGAFSFWFWWTREYTFKKAELPLFFGLGFIGLITWIVGYKFHGHRLGYNIFGIKE